MAQPDGRDADLARVLRLFRAAVDVDPAERAELLSQACAGDASLRRRVAALLAADELASGFLERAVPPLLPPLQRAAPAPPPAALAPMDPMDPIGPIGPMDSIDPTAVETGAAILAAGLQGTRLGPYELIAALGSGGMGTVFLAERRDGQYEQRVALKVARLGMSGGEARRRFLLERQILATLDHPNIARLLDGGVTEEGIPFFVMEYVEGEPITEYCSRRSLALGARLDLFLRVCAAVEHAHRRLIVHRDLKPSNIMVTAGGEVKLLDFGIAKLVGEDAPALTRSAERFLTPAYAAPEQIRGEAITTATDVYSLGVVLYELLAGRRPFVAAAAASPVALAAAILDEEPPRPSTVASSPEPAPAAEVSRSLRRWRGALRGDLDTIVLAALKKEPERRYPSAEALADDVSRHRRGLPIKVRPDTLGYRTGKFVARHRAAAAAAVFVLAALVAVLAAALWLARERAREAVRAEREAEASQAVTRFLVSLFEGSDPSRSRGAVVTAQELLDEGAQRLRSGLGDQPAVRARLLHAVASTYVALGLYGRARPLEEEALRLRRQHLPAGDPQVAESLDGLGEILRLSEDYGRAEPLLREALALRRSAADPAGGAAPAAAGEIAESLAHLASLLHDKGDFKGADRTYLAALAATRRGFGARHAETASRLSDLAGNRQDMGRYGEAVDLFRQALAIRRQTLGPNHPDVGLSLHDLGSALAALGSYGEAERDLEEALALRRKVLGPAHPAVGSTELALADLYDGIERYDDAERHARAALALFRRSLGDGDRKVSESLNLLAALRTRRRDFAGGAALFRDVLERCSRALGADHPDTLTVKGNLAWALMHSGALGEAERLQRELLAQIKSDNGQPAVVLVRLNLALTLVEEGRPEEAEKLAREALGLQRRLFGTAHEDLAMALRWLAFVEADNGKRGAAEADLRAALRLAQEMAPRSGTQIVRSEIALGDLLVGEGRAAEALPLLRSALASLAAGEPDPDAFWRAEAQLLLAAARRESGGGSRQEAPGEVSAGAAARQLLRGLPGVAVDLFPTARALADLGAAPNRRPWRA
jgi:serine/threonine protein kinase/tetratricopeptide (TPR) repeat protein